MIRFEQNLIYGIVIIWIIAVVLAELSNAYRLKSIRTLADRKLFGFFLAVLILLLRRTVLEDSPETPFYLFIFYIVIVDYFALYLWGAYAFVRGAHLFSFLVGKNQSYENNWPMSKRLKFCRFFAWTLGVFIMIRASCFIIPWIIVMIMS
jgi:hypothetical protein